jgi:release factor glutamine methyltransferase
MKDARLLADNIDLSLGEAIVEIERLFTHAAGISRLDWIKTPSMDNWPDGLSRYKEYLADRLAGVPLAYITGEKEFYGTSLQINQDVLCPRPETELLVDIALDKLRVLGTASVLELGVGSGAVSIAIALNHRGSEITAIDISNNAIQIAKKNVDEFGLSERVKLRCGNWFDNLSDKYDLIVSNPPYIAVGDSHLQNMTLLHEPKIALASGIDGLDAIREIICESPPRLKKGGWLLFEHGYDQGLQCRNLLRKAKFSDVFTKADLSGNERVSGGTI